MRFLSVSVIAASTFALNLATASSEIRDDSALSACFSNRAYLGQPASTVFNTDFGIFKTFQMQLAFSNTTSNTFGEIWKGNDNSLVLVFRGTQIASLVNINSDIDYVQIDCVLGNGNCGKVHRGFQNSYLDVKVYIQQILMDNSNTNSILITGHSLGGAMAALAMFDIISNYPNFQQVKLYTFGQPRVGDGDFMNSFRAATGSLQRFTYVRCVSVQKHFEFRPEQDIVTLVPPLSLGFVDLIDQSNLTLPNAVPVQVPGLHSSVRYFNETILLLSKPSIWAWLGKTEVPFSTTSPSATATSGGKSAQICLTAMLLGFLYHAL